MYVLQEQLDRLVSLGIAKLAGISVADFVALAAGLPDRADGIVVVHPRLVPASQLVPLLAHGGKPGFVVEDMVDLDAYEPRADIAIPDRPSTS